ANVAEVLLVSILLGWPKLGWLSKSNASQRTCRFNLSVILVFLITERSTFLKSGPTMLLRPRLPSVVCVVGLAKLDGRTHWPNGFSVTTRGPVTIGVTVLPTPVTPAEGMTTLNGFPLCRLTIVANSQPLTKRLPLKGRS